MASKEQKLPNIPAAAANGHSHGYTRGDAEAASAASHDARQQRRKKRQKCLLYIVLFIIFQSAVIAVFSLTIMKIRTPKFSVRSATFDNFNSTTKPPFSTRMNVVLRLKNSNFGRYKYTNTTIHFSYRGTAIGEALVSNSYAKWKSTKTILVAADLDFAGAQSELTRDLNDGVVPISSQAQLRGKVELLYVMKKKKSTDLKCSMDISTVTQQLTNIVCH